MGVFVIPVFLFLSSLFSLKKRRFLLIFLRSKNAQMVVALMLHAPKTSHCDVIIIVTPSFRNRPE